MWRAEGGPARAHAPHPPTSVFSLTVDYVSHSAVMYRYVESSLTFSPPGVTAILFGHSLFSPTYDIAVRQSQWRVEPLRAGHGRSCSRFSARCQARCSCLNGTNILRHRNSVLRGSFELLGSAHICVLFYFMFIGPVVQAGCIRPMVALAHVGRARVTEDAVLALIPITCFTP